MSLLVYFIIGIILGFICAGITFYGFWVNEKFEIRSFIVGDVYDGGDVGFEIILYMIGIFAVTLFWPIIIPLGTIGVTIYLYLLKLRNKNIKKKQFLNDSI